MTFGEYSRILFFYFIIPDSTLYIEGENLPVEGSWAVKSIWSRWWDGSSQETLRFVIAFPRVEMEPQKQMQTAYG